MATTLHPLLTVEEYLELDRVSETRLEFLNGEVFDMVGANKLHIMLVSNLVLRIGIQLDGRPYLVATHDFRVSAPGSDEYVYPDVVISAEHAATEPIQGVDTLHEPLVVIEVLSPSTKQRDATEKKDFYLSIPGLQSYVLVSSETMKVEHYARQSEHDWTYSVLTDPQATLRLDVLDVSLPLAQIYDRVEFAH